MDLNFKNKKGNAIVDGATILVVIFVLAILGFVGYIVLFDVNADIQADDDISTEGKVAVQKVTTNYPDIMDKGFLFAFVLFWILLLVASYMVDSHPIFFVIALILMIFVIYIGAELSNAFEEISEDDEFGTHADSFPITVWIMNHLVLEIIGILFSIGIVLYGKLQ